MRQARKQLLLHALADQVHERSAVGMLFLIVHGESTQNEIFPEDRKHPSLASTVIQGGHEDECDRMMERILTDEVAVTRARAAARERAAADFAWADVLGDYEHELAVLGGHVPVREGGLSVRLAVGSGGRP